jgi:hypothetical protein
MNTMWIQFQIWGGVFCSDKLVVSDGEGITGIAGAGAGAGAGAVRVLVRVMRC